MPPPQHREAHSWGDSYLGEVFWPEPATFWHFEIVTQALPDRLYVRFCAQQVCRRIPETGDLMVIDDVIAARFAKLVVNKLVEMIETHTVILQAEPSPPRRQPLKADSSPSPPLRPRHGTGTTRREQLDMSPERRVRQPPPSHAFHFLKHPSIDKVIEL